MVKEHRPEAKEALGFTTAKRIWPPSGLHFGGVGQEDPTYLLANPWGPARFPWEGAARLDQAIKGPSPNLFLCLLLAQVLGCFSLRLPWEPQVVKGCASWTP